MKLERSRPWSGATRLAVPLILVALLSTRAAVAAAGEPAGGQPALYYLEYGRKAGKAYARATSVPHEETLLAGRVGKPLFKRDAELIRATPEALAALLKVMGEKDVERADPVGGLKVRVMYAFRRDRPFKLWRSEYEMGAGTPRPLTLDAAVALVLQLKDLHLREHQERFVRAHVASDGWQVQDTTVHAPGWMDDDGALYGDLRRATAFLDWFAWEVYLEGEDRPFFRWDSREQGGGD